MKKHVYYISLFLLIFSKNLLFAGAPNVINVKDFGAKGDGKHDDTRVIQDAIDHAALQGETVIFPSGTYLVRDLKISASLEGQATTILQRIPSTSNGHYDFCVVGRQKGLAIKNIVFDANSNLGKRKSAATNKGIPLFVFSSKDIVVEQCQFLNASMSGLRIESSSNILVDRSVARNSSGNFGDGFYFSKSHNIIVKNTSAKNYTRIGFVVENQSSDITFDNCLASVGTNASILHGGGEYNAGFWYENSANVYTKNCVANKNSHRGFVAAGSIKGDNPAKFVFEDCVSEDNPVGFSLSSKRGGEVSILVRNCKAINVERGFVATARHLKDKFEFENCEAHLRKISSRSLNSMGFMWESPVSKDNKNYKSLPIFSYSKSKVVYDKEEHLTAIKNSKTNNGDIATYSGGRAKIIIRGVTNSLTDDKLILKARTGNPQYIYD